MSKVTPSQKMVVYWLTAAINEKKPALVVQASFN